MTQSEHSPADMTLERLVHASKTSRLLVHRIAAKRAIANMKLSQFLSDPVGSRRLLTSPRYFGYKASGELLKLIETTLVGPLARSLAEQEAALSLGRAAFRILVGLLAPYSFPSVVLAMDASVRMQKGLAQSKTCWGNAGRWEAEVPNLGVALEKWPEIRAKLLVQPNFGSRTLAELEGVIETIVANVIALSAGASVGVPEINIDRLNGRALGAGLVDVLIGIGGRDGGATSARDAPDVPLVLWGARLDSNLSPRKHVSRVVFALPRKERDVIVRRFGLEGHPGETLAEVAADYQVTKESVRQVEAKALARLRTVAYVGAFDRLLMANRKRTKKALAGNGTPLVRLDIHGHGPWFPPELLLAVAVVHGHSRFAAEPRLGCSGGMALQVG